MFVGACIKCRSSHHSALSLDFCKNLDYFGRPHIEGIYLWHRVKMADDYGVTFYDCKLSQQTGREFVFTVIISSDHNCFQRLHDALIFKFRQ